MLYESPLPVLNVSVDSLTIETKDKYTGQFKIKNTGHGELSGRIISRLPGLKFDVEKWRGNNQDINFTWDAQQGAIKAGDNKSGAIIVSSNGGEKIIPVDLKYTRMSIVSASGLTIANVRDFYEYSKLNIDGARRMFTDSEFYMLLLATGYPYLEVYENLHKDANRERAMDNFFVLSGLKEKTEVTIKQKKLEFVTNGDELQRGRIEVSKTDTGYASAEITKLHDSDWLSLSTGRLASLDFNESLQATVNFTIDPKKIPASFAREEILIGQDLAPDKSNVVEIIYRTPIQIKARLSRETFRFEDSGHLIVYNNTGQTIAVEPFSKEKYIHFHSKTFVVTEYAEIPFDIKLTAFLGAQIYFRKIAYLKAFIEVMFKFPGKAHKKILPVVVGGW